MNNLQGLANKPGHEIRKLRRSPATTGPHLAGQFRRLQGGADAALDK